MFLSSSEYKFLAKFINFSFLDRWGIIQSMIVASSAEGEKEIQRALQRLNQLSQEQQIALAKTTSLDTPRMPDLREKLRLHQEQQREVVDTEKQKNAAQKER
ncbi:MAG: hypothetical protein ACJAZW_001688 [Maritalea sp.]